MFARILKSVNGEAERITIDAPDREDQQDAVVDARGCPAAFASARGLRHPHRVGDRADEDVGVAELRLEQDPEAVEEREEPEAWPDLAQILGLIRAGGQALQIGAVRDDRGREVDVQEHPDEAEQAPHPDLVGVHVAQPFAPAREVLRSWPGTPCRRATAGSAWPPTALGMAPTSAPMPKPLSRTQFVTVRLPMPPEPAVAASAPMSAQSIGCGRPEKLKNPANVVHQCEAARRRRSR